MNRTCKAVVVVALICLFLAPGRAQAREWRFEASVTGRYGFLPSSFLDSFFDVHGEIRGFGPGIELGWTKDGFHAIGVCDIIFVNTPPQVWLEKGDKKMDAIWIEEDLKLLSYGVVFAYEWRIVGPVSIMPGIGFVPVQLEGELLQYPTDGDKDTEVEDRTKAEGIGGKSVRLPQQFKGADLGLRIRVQPSERWFLSADIGWRMIIYTGLTAGVAF